MAATLPLGTPDRSDCFACCHLAVRRSFANPAKEKQKKRWKAECARPATSAAEKLRGRRSLPPSSRCCRSLFLSAWLGVTAEKQLIARAAAEIGAGALARTPEQPY